MTNNRPLVIAHRGYADESAPENSIAAFRRAWRSGAQALETDVRQTKDGVLVLHHDREVVCCCGERHRLSDLTLSQIQKVTDRRLPTILDVLSIAWQEAPPDSTLFLEVKNDDANVGVADVALECVRWVAFIRDNCRLSRPLPRIVVTTNSAEAIEQTARFIFSSKLEGVAEVGFTLLSFLDFAAAHTFHRKYPTGFVSIPAQYHTTFSFLFRPRALLYTVNIPEDAHTFFDQGVAGVFTDNLEGVLLVRDAPSHHLR